jgi:hypothetical protein
MISKAAKILTSALIGVFVCFFGTANIGFFLPSRRNLSIYAIILHSFPL